ncbi:unnamed protein product [Closterium sp. NIES-53]
MLAALKPCLPRRLNRVLCTALHPSAAHRALQPVQYRVLVLWDQAQAAAGTAWIRGFTANSGGDSGNGSNAGGKKGDSAADVPIASEKGDSARRGLAAEVAAEGGGESARVAEASAEGAGEAAGEAAASEASAEAVGEEVAADAVVHAGYHGARRGRIRRRDSRIRSATEVRGASSAPAAAAANAEVAARGGDSVGANGGGNAGASAEGGAEFVMGEGAAGEGAGEGGGLAEETSIVPAGPRPEHYPKVLAIPLTRRPLFPGFYVPVIVKNPKLVAALQALKAQGTPYVGAFPFLSSPLFPRSPLSPNRSTPSPPQNPKLVAALQALKAQETPYVATLPHPLPLPHSFHPPASSSLPHMAPAEPQAGGGAAGAQGARHALCGCVPSPG